MMDESFKLEILSPGKADVLFASAKQEISWEIVEQLDRAGARVIGDTNDEAPDRERARELLCGCSGLITTGLSTPGLCSLGVPQLVVSAETTPDVGSFQDAVLRVGDRIRPYAFMVGRLERDFRHAREAMRVAVEGEAGIPLLWADDGRHRTNMESVRERTRLLIKNATFVIADLTLGVESPERENPSRAHEIGMAIAYQRPLLLCSQEPRRYPYFSIGDMQLMFWLTEDELEAGIKDWIRLNRKVARHVFNYELPSPVIAKPVFSYDPELRYIGPKTKVPFRFGTRHFWTGLRDKLS